MRFHRGAFYLAQQIGADILPMFIHGTGHVMPKNSGLAARGRIDIEIGQRIPANKLHTFGEDHQMLTHTFHQMYLQHYDQMRREIETTHYFHHYIIHKYTYKGIGVEKDTRRLLKQYDDFSQWIDGYQKPSAGSVAILNAGKGQFALLFALVHPDIEVNSYAYDPDDAALLASCEPMPANLHAYYCKDEEAARQATGNSEIINLSNIIQS